MNILSEVSQRKILYHLCEESLKINDMNELFYKTETEAQTWKR